MSFETEVELGITVPSSELRSARRQIEDGLGDIEVGVSAGGGGASRAMGDGGGMGSRQRRMFRWARERTGHLDDAVNLLEDIDDKLDDGGGGGGGGGGLLSGAILGRAAGGVGGGLLGGRLAGALGGGAAAAGGAAGATLLGGAVAAFLGQEIVAGQSERGEEVVGERRQAALNPLQNPAEFAQLLLDPTGGIEAGGGQLGGAAGRGTGRIFAGLQPPAWMQETPPWWEQRGADVGPRFAGTGLNPNDPMGQTNRLTEPPLDFAGTGRNPQDPAFRLRFAGTGRNPNDPGEATRTTVNQGDTRVEVRTEGVDRDEVERIVDETTQEKVEDLEQRIERAAGRGPGL